MKFRTSGWLFAAMLLAGSPQAFAQTWTATQAGTTVTNTATVNYEVDGVAQTAEDSDPDVFTVDRKIDVSVARVGSYITATPGAAATSSAARALAFDVQNLTNDTMDIALLAQNMVQDHIPGTPADDAGQISAAFSYFVDKTEAEGADPVTEVGVWDAGDAPASAGSSPYLDNMAAGETRRVFVVADIPADLVDGDKLAVALTGIVRNPAAVGALGGTPVVLVDSDANTMGGVAENIFADNTGGVVDDGVTNDDVVRDGRFTAAGAYQIAKASLEVVKASFILDDGLTGAITSDDTNPKAIPGATILYCITIVNSGAVAAESVELSDTIAGANATYVHDSIQVEPGDAIACDATTLSDTDLVGKLDAALPDDGAVATYGVDPLGDDAADDDTITVALGTMAAGAEATIVFKATID